MFKAETLDAVGGRLYPWQNGPRAESGRGGGVPMAGTPSHAVVATERCLRFSHGELRLHTEDSITVFNLRVVPACFTLAPSVTRLGAEAPLRAFQTARLLQATGSVPVTFAVPFCTRPDSGEDDYVLVIGPSFASWHTPTCLGRRMNQTTHNLLAHVVPAQPLRQWVLSLPYALRAPLAYEPGLMSVVARVFEDSLLRWYERRLAPGDSPGERAAQGGLLTVIERSSGDMRLNPHLHVVALDGVYVAGPDGQPAFRALGRLKTDEVADVVQITKARVLKALERRGVVRVSPEALEVDESFAASDPVLAQLAAAAVAGLPPAGPAERKREPLVLAASGGPEIVGDLVVQDCGFNLHAKTCAGAVDDDARARLLRYVLRPPLAQDRLAVLPDHRIRLTLKRPWSDGTYALDMDALALLARLASSVPPPKQHLTRYSGVLAAAAHWRPLIIPPAPADSSASTAPAPLPPSVPAQPAFTKPSKPPPSGTRCRYIRWAELLRLTFGLTVDECPACGGRMKLRALVRDPESIERFLRHQNLWSPPQDIAPARAPPYHRKVTRLSPTRQQELFPET